MTLDNLIKAVEAGEWDHDAAAKWLWMKPGQHYGWAHDAFSGSLDAAKALHDALLPGWWAALRHSTRPKATVGYVDRVFEGQDDLLSRAWLLAILKAKQAQVKA